MRSFMPSFFVKHKRTKPLMLAMAVVPMLMSATVIGAQSANADSTINIWRSWNHGTCLDSDASGNVYSITCNGHDYQEWTDNRVKTGAGGADRGTYQVIDKATGRCLDSNRHQSHGGQGDVYTLPCTPNNTYQMWTVWNPSNHVGQNVYWLINYETALTLRIDAKGKVITEYGASVESDLKRGF